MRRLFSFWKNKYRSYIFRAERKKDGCYIHPTAHLYNLKNIKLSRNAEIWENAVIRAYSSEVAIGENSQVGPQTILLSGDYGIKIGDNVMVGPHCVFAAGVHEYRDLTVPMRMAGSFSNGPIIVEDDVWIGANCTITDNVRISKGAIIGANSVVNKNVNAYDIVAGNPAKKIRSRIEKENENNN